jgi:hypothetical protein
MDRRRFFVATAPMAAAPLLVFPSRVRASAGAEGGEVQGNLRRLTEPVRGDNRATFMPDRGGRGGFWEVVRRHLRSYGPHRAPS